jgi:hypothetical protein
MNQSINQSIKILLKNFFISTKALIFLLMFKKELIVFLCFLIELFFILPIILLFQLKDVSVLFPFIRLLSYG